MPSDVSVAELCEQFLVTEEFIMALQNERWINLEGDFET